MFPTRLYGAPMRVVITAALLLAVLVAAFMSHAHAAERFAFGSFAERAALQVPRDPIEFFAPPPVDGNR